MNNQNSLFVETLEERIAPATLVSASVVQFFDVDGDIVTVKTNKGTFDIGAHFTFADEGIGERLQALNLNQPQFAGATITIQSTQANGGDGFVNVGRISANVDLASVTIDGDLGRINAGDKLFSTPGLGVLRVASMGVEGVSTQPPAGDLLSNIAGRLGSLIVAGHVENAALITTGGSFGSIGLIQIGGDLKATNADDDSARINASGSITKTVITGSIIGNAGERSGIIFTSQSFGTVSIGGDLKGDVGLDSGQIKGQGAKTVFIGGSVVEGAADRSGTISIAGGVQKLTVLGSIDGGGGPFSGHVGVLGHLGVAVIGSDPLTNAISGSTAVNSGQVIAKSIGSISVTGSVVGGTGANSGSISTSDGGIGTVKILGSLVGGGNQFTGAVTVSALNPLLGIGTVDITGDIQGGSNIRSGIVQVQTGAGGIGLLKVGGSIEGGAGGTSGSGGVMLKGTLAKASVNGDITGGENAAGSQNGFVSAGTIGTFLLGGDLIGNDATFSGRIDSDGSITSLVIKGKIEGGAGESSGAISADGRIATLKVGTNPLTDGILGGSGNRSAFIEAAGIGRATIIGSMVGDGPQSGSINILSGGIGQFLLNGDLDGSVGGDDAALIKLQSGAIGTLTITGELIGGASINTGAIVTVDAGIGKLKIGGGITGGAGLFSGTIDSAGGITDFFSGASVTGGGGFRSGTIHAQGDITKLTIMGDLKGGSEDSSGSIRSENGGLGTARITGDIVGLVTGAGNSTAMLDFSFGNIGKVTIGGKLIGGGIELAQTRENTGGIRAINIGSVIVSGIEAGANLAGNLTNSGFIRADGQLKSLTVLGDVVGNTSAQLVKVMISGLGQLKPTATTDLAIGSVKIGGDASYLEILGGFSSNNNGIDGDRRGAQIGTVTVGGDWEGGSIAAGISKVGLSFGLLTNTSIPDANTGAGTRISKIASIVIKGNTIETPAGGDFFGFVAQQLGSVKINGANVPLTAGPQNDTAQIPTPASDLFVLERI